MNEPHNEPENIAERGRVSRMKRVSVFVVTLLGFVVNLPAQQLAVRVSEMLDPGEYADAVADTFEAQFAMQGGTSPLLAQGTCAPDVTRIVVEHYLQGDQDTAPGNLINTYTLKRFKAGDTSFSYRMAPGLGNLMTGTNAYVFSAFHKAETVEKKIFSVSYQPLDYERPPAPQPPALPGQSFTFARMTAQGLRLGDKFAGTGDPSTFRLGLNFYLRTDGSVLSGLPGQDTWVFVEPFSDGVGVVLSGDRESGDWLAINATGKTILRLPAHPLYGFVSGFALVPTSGTAYNVIDLTGKVVLASVSDFEGGVNPLLPKTLTYVVARGVTIRAFSLPSGKEIALPGNAQIGVYRDSQGHVYRCIYAYDQSRDQTDLRFTDEAGNQTGELTLPGAVDSFGGVGWVGTWDPESRVVAVRFKTADGARTLGIDVTGKVIFALPPDADVNQVAGRFCLLHSGTIPFVFNTAKGDFAVPFRSDADWLDARTSQVFDSAQGRFQVADLVSNKTFALPLGKRAIWRSGDWLCLESFDSNTWSPPNHMYYAEVNDSKVRVRSTPSLGGAILGSLDKGIHVWIDGVGSPAVTVDGYLGFWIHILADGEDYGDGTTWKGPAGWMFSRFVHGIGSTDDQ